MVVGMWYLIIAGMWYLIIAGMWYFIVARMWYLIIAGMWYLIIAGEDLLYVVNTKATEHRASVYYTASPGEQHIQCSVQIVGSS